MTSGHVASSRPARTAGPRTSGSGAWSAWGAVLLFVLLAAPLARAADPDQPLTLLDCFRKAVERSEVLADQQELLVQSEEQYQQALGAVLPSVLLGAAYQRLGTGTYSGFAPGPTTTSDRHEVLISARQPLFRGFREFAALRAAGDLIRTRTEARQWAGMQLYRDVVRGFYQVAVLEKDIEHITVQLALYDQRVRDLQGRVAIGRSRTSEVLTVQTSRALLQAEREQTQGQARVAREVLAFLTGGPVSAGLADLTPVPERTDALEAYLAGVPDRPDVKAAQARADAAREAVTIASNAHLPDLDLSGAYYLDHAGPQPTTVWDAEISLTLPIFSGFTLVSRTREAESLARQSENALSQVRRLGVRDVTSAYHVLRSDLDQLAALRTAADLAERNYRAILRDYNLGLETNLDVLQALQTHQDSLRALDRVLLAAKADLEVLETAAGRRLNLYPGAGSR